MDVRSRLLRMLAVLAVAPPVSGNWIGRAVPVIGGSALLCPLPVGDWVATSLEGAPDPTRPRLAAWTGSRLLVVNQNGEGGLFDVCANRWSHVSTEGVPRHLALYGDRLNYPPVAVGNYVVFLFTGTYGSLSPFASASSAVIYDIERNRWRVAKADGAPAPRADAVVAGTGKDVIVWGGVGHLPDGRDVRLGDGARLDPATGRWRPLSTVNAPSPRTAGGAATVWTGTRLVIWDGGSAPPTPARPCPPGESCSLIGDGASYDPRTDRWTAISRVGAPSKRYGAVALAHTHEVVIWGGSGKTDGAVLDVQKDVWQPISAAPEEFGEPRLARAYRVYLDDNHLVVVAPHMQAVTFALRDRRWTVVQGHPPVFNGFLPDFVIDDPSVVIHVGCHFAVGAVPTRQCLQTGWIARVNVAVSRWEAAHFPERGAPPSVVGASTLWTGHRRIVWGGFEPVPDPGGRTGCEGAQRPCDPVAPTKPLFHRAGGMLSPLFSPAE
jgi:hypothetical protein